MNTILQFYSTIPYHNAPHAQFVRANLIQMGISDRVSLLSAEGHDALHTGTPRSGDEEISALMTARIGVLHGLINPREWDQVIEKIRGTIFKDRSRLLGSQVHLADADIWLVGWNFDAFIRNSTRLFIENCFSSWNLSPTSNQFKEYFNKSQEGFYSFLTGITGKPDVPFLTSEAQKVLPNFPYNRDRLREMVENDFMSLTEILKEEWLLFFKVPLTVE